MFFSSSHFSAANWKEWLRKKKQTLLYDSPFLTHYKVEAEEEEVAFTKSIKWDIQYNCVYAW